MNPLGGYDTWHKISSTGYFSWTASQTGGSSGYVDVLYNGQYVAGVSVNGNCG